MRIIAGKYAKRNLYTLKSNKTRPTSDKVKGSLFNSLGQFFSGGNVLDLYAGSGALGIEAVSRGYDKASLVDINYQAVNVINKNVALTKEQSRFKVINKRDISAIKLLSKNNEKFDLVFLDPPYAKQKIVDIMTLFLKANILNANAQIIAETDEHDTLPEIQGYILEKKHQLGRTILWFYREKR